MAAATAVTNPDARARRILERGAVVTPTRGVGDDTDDDREGATRVGDLERELHELESSEEALDQRTDNLAMRGGFTILLTFFAPAIAIVAMAVALISSGRPRRRP